MTVSSTARRAGPFNGNDATTSFTFSFKVFSALDIYVQLQTATGTVSTLTPYADYGVTLNANQDTSPGGSVTYPVSGAPLATGERLTIMGGMDITQETDLPAGGRYSALTIENAFDKLTMVDQEQQEQLNRSLVIPSTAAWASNDLPVPEANNLIGWDNTGFFLKNVPVTDLAGYGPAVAVSDINVMDYGATGDGVTDDYAAIQSAVTAAMALPTGGTVWFPAGTYLLSGSVTLKGAENVHLVGSGIGSTVIKRTANLAVNVASFRFYLGRKNSIENLTLDCQNYQGRGVLLQDISTVCRSVQVLNCPSRPFGMNGGSNETYGLDSEGREDSRPEFTTASFFPERCEIRDCRVYNYGRTALSQKWMPESKIIGNHVELGYSEGVTADLCDFSIIANNTLVNVARTNTESAFLDPDPATQTATITSITNASPGVVTTSAAHGLQGDSYGRDFVLFADVGGMTELNGKCYKVNVLTDTTFEINGVDTSGYTAYTSGGTTTRYHNCGDGGVGGFGFDSSYNTIFSNNVIRGVQIPAVWGTNRYFVAGEFVTNGGTNYECILSHMTASASEPGVGGSWATYWSLITYANALNKRTRPAINCPNNLSDTVPGLSHPDSRGCVIDGNIIRNAKCGVLLRDYGGGVCTDNVISSNVFQQIGTADTATGGFGVYGAIWVDSESTGNVIHGNTADGQDLLIVDIAGNTVSPVDVPIATDGRTLYKWRAYANTLLGGSSDVLRVAMMGDSWTNLVTIPNAVMGVLDPVYGTSGTGWIPVGDGNAPTGITNTESGWTKYDASGGASAADGCGPDGHAIYATGTAATVAMSGWVDDGLRIYYKDGDGVFRYNIDGGAWATVTCGNTGAMDTIDLTGLGAGPHTLNVDLTGNTGTVRLYGYLARRPSTGGVTMVKMGNGGLRGDHWSNYATQIEPFIADLVPHVVVVIIGTNDSNQAGGSVAGFFAGISDLIDAIRAGHPTAGIILCMPSDNGGAGSGPDIALLRDSMYSVSRFKGVEFMNFHDAMSTYATMNSMGMFADTVHLSADGARVFASMLCNRFLCRES